MFLTQNVEKCNMLIYWFYFKGGVKEKREFWPNQCADGDICQLCVKCRILHTLFIFVQAHVQVFHTITHTINLFEGIYLRLG